MTARQHLQRVTRATRQRDRADDNYRGAILAAREAGATLRQIADAASTGPPNVLRIIRRAKGDVSAHDAGTYVLRPRRRAKGQTT